MSAHPLHGRACLHAREEDLVGAINLHLSQQIREDRMLRMQLAGSEPFVDRLQAHLGHQSPDAMPPNSPGIWWTGSTMKRFGSEVQILQMYS